MKNKLTVTTENDKISEVRAVWDQDEANLLLKNGWTLLHGCVAHKDGMGYQAKPCWLMGKLKG